MQHLCRYYNTTQGCRYGTKCRFVHRNQVAFNQTKHYNNNGFHVNNNNVNTSSINKIRPNQQNEDKYKCHIGPNTNDNDDDSKNEPNKAEQNNAELTGYGLKTLKELLFYFTKSNYNKNAIHISTYYDGISSIIERNKNNVLFMNMITGRYDLTYDQIASIQFVPEDNQNIFMQCKNSKKSTKYRINILISVINIIIKLNGYDQQQIVWFKIALYLHKVLNKSLLHCIFCGNQLTINSFSSVCCDTNNKYHDCALSVLLKEFKNDLYCDNTISYLMNILQQIMALNPTLKLPLFIVSVKKNSYGHYGHFYVNSPYQFLSEFPSPKLLMRLFKISNIGRILPFDCDADYKLDTKKKLNEIWSQIPLHFIIITIRVFRDIYWNEIQDIITDIMSLNDDCDIINNINDILYETTEWNLDVMQVIVDYVDDNDSLSYCDRHEMYQCDELENVEDVIRCLKIFDRNKVKPNGFGYGCKKATAQTIQEWLDYFVKHRRYKYIPKSSQELKKTNFFANRALFK